MVSIAKETNIKAEKNLNTIALHVFEESAQGVYFVLLIILAPIYIAATILRFSATRRSRRSLGLEYQFALTALILYLASTILSLYGKSSLLRMRQFKYFLGQQSDSHLRDLQS